MCVGALISVSDTPTFSQEANGGGSNPDLYFNLAQVCVRVEKGKWVGGRGIGGIVGRVLIAVCVCVWKRAWRQPCLPEHTLTHPHATLIHCPTRPLSQVRSYREEFSQAAAALHKAADLDPGLPVAGHLRWVEGLDD